ncbi:zinc finger CCHC domain-containing protein 8 [Echeneis naucrates]|uniref:Zinc finger CCHC domain-containing protein 8 n=1 Tax=Echeneis naucrates TaxID=173247 RepID=A0A665X652_ECHNA|nr:zinc finger CCHC domain-containing protein 8 [Echeneis naucrates]
MAEVDFGDRELFEQLDESAPPAPTHVRFTDDEDESEETSQLRSRLEESDALIQRLTEENKCLRRQLNILARPSGITVEDVNMDGPLLQILFTNNNISKQYRQEIEDYICSVILKNQKLGHGKQKSFHIKPQNSAFALEEDLLKMASSHVQTTTEAFKVVGSVLYFTTFSVDRLGQPLVNENPQLTDGWDIPTYHQIFNQVVGTDGQEIEMKDKRPKSMCFNCGSSGHQMRDCPNPKDIVAINERRKEFNQSNNQTIQSNQRYHADEVEERFSKYKPGVMSEELLTALGVDGNTLPPLIYRMRQLGYPPGWLKEAEMENSGLTLYDGNASNSGSVTNNSQDLSYDVSKLIDFPGFNVAAPDKMKDEFMQYGSIPIQSSHMKQNYAAYLSNNFPMPGATCKKRRHESDSSPQLRKKNRSSPDRISDRSSDMDIESDPGTPYHSQSQGDFQFQPPLPPGSPCFSSPPPLPQGTPPATPTPPPLPKGTPPSTPTNGSPAFQRRNWVVIDETMDGAEDELTLEELEEQQRLIRAALENADTATNSDCETPAMGTPIPSSPSVSTSANIDTETEEADEAMDTSRPVEVFSTSDNEGEQNSEEIFSQNPGQSKVEDDRPQSPGPVKSHDGCPQSPGPVKDHNDNPQSPGPVKSQDDSPESPDPVKPHEDTPQSPDPVKPHEDTPQSPDPVKPHEDTPQSPDLVKPHEDTPQSPDPVKPHEDTPQSPDPVKPHKDTPQSPDPIKSLEDSPQSPDQDFYNKGAGDCASPKQAEKITAVPHRSKFATGIVQFEDTPEFTEVAEATGTYRRIRDLLKSSPRNLAKKK